MRVALASQVATIRLKPGAPIVPAQLRAAVERAGQRLQRVEVHLRGTLQKNSGRYQLQPARLDLPRASVSESRGQVFVIRDHVKLESLAGRTVRVRGRVVSSDAAAVELELMDVEPL